MAISAVGAVCLLLVYAAWLFAYLRSDRASERSLAEPAHSVLPFPIAVTVPAGLRRPRRLQLGLVRRCPRPSRRGPRISKTFTGLVIVAIAGNAVENVVAVSLAWKGQNDLAISVVKNSVSQIACFLFPVLVLASLAFTHHLTFVIDPVYLGALALTAIALWQITATARRFSSRALPSSACTWCSPR